MLKKIIVLLSLIYGIVHADGVVTLPSGQTITKITRAHGVIVYEKRESDGRLIVRTWVQEGGYDYHDPQNPLNPTEDARTVFNRLRLEYTSHSQVAAVCASRRPPRTL